MPALTGILEGHQTRAETARQTKKSERTIIRWENLPDGLPVTIVGQLRLHHIETARAWIASRMQRRNPRRRAA
jgi:hypothetical protein